MQKRNNKMLVPFLIAGELFVLFISYIISGVWKEGMDVITLLNRLNDAIGHPFKNYWTEYSLKAMIVGTLIYAIAVLLYITSRRNFMQGLLRKFKLNEEQWKKVNYIRQNYDYQKV